MFFQLLIGFCASLQQPASISSSDLPRYSIYDRTKIDFSIKSPVNGGFQSCFLVTVTAQNQLFSLMIDTGSSDTVLPHVGVNNYVGPSITVPGISTMISTSGYYGDTSWWKGPVIRMEVGLPGSNIVANQAPIAIMTSQSTNPVFVSGGIRNGLLGLGFESLSHADKAPYTLMDSWVQEKVIASNTIAFHGCPYDKELQSWIDFGDETPYFGCGNESASIVMPSKSYYNIDLLGLLSNDKNLSLPLHFQKTSSGESKYSILDSCTSLIYLPENAAVEFRNEMINSLAFSKTLQNSQYFEKWINGSIMLSNLASHIDYSLLPNLTFTVASGKSEYTSVDLVLGPRQYIQRDSNGYYEVMFVSTSNSYAILGLPFFSAYHITVDRDIGTIDFKLGCGCETSIDGYPKLRKGNRTIQTQSNTKTKSSASIEDRSLLIWVVAVLSWML